MVADAFVAAFRLPNLFRRLFAEGALAAAFVPIFSRELEGEDAEIARRQAREFAEQAQAVLALVVLVGVMELSI